MNGAIRLHASHGNHELRCYTHGCPAYDRPLTDFPTKRVHACLCDHAVRCVACHTWADQPAKPSHPAPEPATALAVNAASPDPDQLPLF